MCMIGICIHRHSDPWSFFRKKILWNFSVSIWNWTSLYPV
jgi:hypothetical protein